MSFAGHSKYTRCEIGQKLERSEGKVFSALAVAEIGTRRRINWTSKANTISESSNQDIHIRQMSQSEQMKDSNDKLD